LLAAAAGTGFQWSLYYEQEGLGDPTVSALQDDLAYIQTHYAADPAYLRINGRPVLFVFADPADGCGMATRWRAANTAGFYVVLKVFSGYRTCADQPDAWHQYGPAVATDSQAGYSYAISPGFWKVGEAPRLLRDLTRWQQNVQSMVASGAPLQLITTFNEWGEGTAVESAQEWASASGFGAYLDILHDNPSRAPTNRVAPPPPSAAAPPTPTTLPGQTITLRQGATLAQVARQRGIPLGALMAYNGISDLRAAGAGTVLRLPPAEYRPATARYVVQPNDNLTRIAGLFRVSIAALTSRNGLRNPNQIYVGQTLVIPLQ
jgi:LysM repeat protein